MKSFIGGKPKVKNGIIYERRIVNRRCKIDKQPMSVHHNTETWFGHTGRIVGEIFSAPTHLTGGYRRYLFISDQNPGMVVPVNVYYVTFDEDS